MREREHRSWHIQRGLSAAVLGAVALAWGLVAAPGKGPSRGSGPGIASVIPEAGPVGTAVVVRGENFGPSIGAWLGTSEVSLNGTAVTPSYWSDGEIRVPVPVGASSGPVVVTVGGVAGVGGEFTVTGPGTSGPGIATVSPVLGPAGTEVVVRGGNFGPASAVAQGASGVSFSGVRGTPSYWSDREIRAPVPPGAPGGQVVVAAAGLAGNGVPFRVTGPAPVIGTVDPNHGPAGTELVIRGMHFGSPIAALQGAGRVSFDGTAGRPSYWSDREIRVPVPAGVESGLVVVTAGGSAGDGVGFTVTPGGKRSGGRTEDWAVSARSTETAAGGAGPEITSLQPLEGAVGAAVRITGANFGATAGELGRVSFNGARGVPTSWSETAIQVPVPSGATTGPVTVTAQAGGVSNGVDFSVLPAISFEAGAAALAEPDGETTVSVRRFPERMFAGSTVTFSYEGTATPGSDYRLGSLDFPAGANTASATLQVLDDSDYEGNEEIEIVAVVQDLLGDSRTFRLKILLVDDDAPALAISAPAGRWEWRPPYRVGVSVPKGAEPAADTPVTFTFGGTAERGTDFEMAETVTLPAGRGHAWTRLAMIDDRRYELLEKIVLQASAPGYRASPEAEVYIFDDDATPLTLTVDRLNLSEEAGERTATYTVSVAEGEEPATDSKITVSARGTARLWRDFRWDVTLVLRAGQRSVTGTLRVIDDGEYEGAETITLTAHGRSGTGLGVSAPVTIEIADDDPPPLTLAVSPAELSEPDGTATLTVTAAVAPETTSTVTLLKSGSAFVGSDYTVGPLTMEPGERTATARLEVTDDSQYEGPETIELRAHMEGYAYSFPLRIPLADDEPVPLTLSVDPRRISEAGGTAILTVSIPRSRREPAEFTLSRSGTATGGSDYTLAETVTIPRNGLSATATLQAIDDETYEGRETVEIQAGADGYATSRRVTVAIEDDEPVPLTLSVSPAEVSEAGGTATLRLAVPEAVSAPVEFTLSRSGTAAGGSDYTLAETVTIPAGRLSATVTLQAIDDEIDEGRETVEIQAAADGYATSPVATVAIHDDDSSGVTVAPTHLNLAEGGSGRYVVRLDSQPLHPVTIAVASDNPDVGASSPLTFSAADWDRGQAVTVTAAHDDDFADESAILTHAAESADLNYRGIAVPGVAVDVTDEGNQPPVCQSVPARSLEVGRSETVDLSAYCSDPDGHALNYTASSSAPGVVTVTPEGNPVTLTGVALGRATVTVTATDGHGGTATVTFPVTVPNRPPVCRDIPLQILWVADSLAVDLSAYCSDPDGHPLRYTAVSLDETRVTESVSGSRLTLTGVAVGSARIRITATDDPGGSRQGLSTTETFTARVDNRDPECETVEGRTVNVNGTKRLTVSCSDGDGHDLNYTASASPSGIVTVTPKGNPLTLTGVAVGNATVTVTATDGHGGTATVTFPVTVPNRPPVCRDIPLQILWVADSLAVDLSAYCSDPDGHPLRYTAVSLDETRVTESVSGSRLTLTGVAVGSARIRITATDDPGGSRQGLSTTETFTATVKNRAPVCSFDGQTIDVNQSRDLGVTAHCTDPDGDSMTYTAARSHDTSIVTVARLNNNTTVRITGKSAGTTRVTVTVADEHGASTSELFSVTVVQPNRPPICNFSGQTIDVNQSRDLGVTAHCTDADGDSMTYTAASSANPSIATAARRSNNTVVRITGKRASTTPVTVTVSDEHNASTTKQFSVTVEDPPPSPEILSFTADSTTICPGECTYLRWETRHADSTLINEGIGRVTSVGGGSKRVCPNEIREYDYILTAIGDPRAIPPQVTEKVTVTVLPSCALSSIGNQALWEDEERTLSLSSACNGTYSASSADTGVVTVSVDNARNKLTITGGSAGTATVTVRVTKPGYKEDSVTFTVTVKRRPPPPVIDSFEATPASITEGSCATLSWTTTDAISVSMNPEIGSGALTVDGSGSDCPSSEEVYTLTATGEEGSDPGMVSRSVTVTVTPPAPTEPSTPEITSISPSLQRPDDPVTISGRHFGNTAGSVSFGGHSISIFSGPGYSWSNTSIGLLIPGSLNAGQVSVTVTTNGGSTSDPYAYTVTGGPVHRGDCGEEDEDCPEEKEKRDEESGDSEEGGTGQGSEGSGGGETEENPAEGGG